MTLLGFDVDDCCADFVPAWLKYYEIRSKHNLLKEELTDWDISNFVRPEFKEEIYTYIERPSLYNTVKPIEGSLEAYNYLCSANYDIVFITHTTNGCAGRKYEWLIENGFDVPHKNYIECQRKELINIDVLVDDRYDNVRDTSGIGILMNQPWNRKYDWDLRADNWKEIVGIIEGRSDSCALS